MEKPKFGSRRHTPRVRTGCKTCKIRRVKCDEKLPFCTRCSSTGRKCDGYTENRPTTSLVREAVKIPTFPQSYTIPFSIPGSQRDRQLLHFYCVQSALDLGGSLNQDFWNDIALQYAQKYPVVRQAVIAFGSIHWHALAIAQNDGLEHFKQYNKAIRLFRKYIALDSHDPQVILLCCALFFNCEIGRGDSNKAIEHLENGLKFLKSIIIQRPCGSVGIGANHLALDLVNPHILHMFSRLDLQASIYGNDRVPVLPLMQDFEAPYPQPFRNIQEAQNSLGILSSRTDRFIVVTAEYRKLSENDLPRWIRNEKQNLLREFDLWKERILVFADTKCYKIFENSDDAAAQIQLLKMQHQVNRMMLRSCHPHNPQVFTQNPNLEAEGLLDACETIVQSLQLTVDKEFKDGEIRKFTSEIGILPLLTFLGVKCSSPTRRRAMNQLKLLRGYREGLFNADLIYKILLALERKAEAAASLAMQQEAKMFESEEVVPPASKTSDSFIKAANDAFEHLSLEDTSADILSEDGGFSHWAKLVGVV